MTQIDGGGAVVSALKRLAVSVIFDLPGLHSLPIYDRLYDEGDIRRIMVKHENNASVMADVYGRLTGEPGVALVAAGPGATNSLSGVAQAMVASSPMLHISGTVPRDSSPYALHGLQDPDFLRTVFAPVSKRSVRVKRFEDIGSAIIKSYSLARKPRKGPVHVEVPFDLLKQKGNESKLQSTVKQGTRRMTSIGPVVKLIESAHSPVAYAGKLVAREAGVDDLVALAERLRAPVVVNAFSPDAFPINHRLFAGSASEWSLDPTAEMALNSADLLLAVGVQWGSEETNFLRRFASIPCVHVDVDRGYPARGHRPLMRLVGSVKTIISQIGASISAKRGVGDLADRVAKMNSVRRRTGESILRERSRARPIYPGLVGAELAKVADKEAVIVLDGSSTSSWIMDVYAKQRSSQLLWPGAYGSIGFAFPAGIAAKVARPHRQVIAATGDGGFLMSCMDMPTPLENNLPFTLVVMNNRAYGDMWHIQRRNYGERYIGTELPTVNYAEFAKSVGALGIRVEEPSMLGDACREAVNSSVFTVLDVVTDAHYPFLHEEIEQRL